MKFDAIISIKLYITTSLSNDIGTLNGRLVYFLTSFSLLNNPLDLQRLHDMSLINHSPLLRVYRFRQLHHSIEHR